MNKAQLLALFNQDQRINVTYPDARREAFPHIVRHVDASGHGEGAIVYSQLDATNADRVIQEQIRYFESIEQDFEWKLYDYDEPSDLLDRLIAHGFVKEEAEALVVLPLADAPAFLWQPVQQDVRRLHDPTQLADVQTVEEAVWDEDMSWIVDYLGTALRHTPEQMSVYVAYVDNQPASAAWTYYQTGSQFASLWGGSTIERYRQQGLYTALLAVRAQEAKDRGVNYLTVDASPMSQPILEKFGFEVLAFTTPCKWNISTKAVL